MWIAAGFYGFCNTNIKSGFEYISEIISLKEIIRNGKLIVTGEGKVDKTSFQGKVLGNVLDMCTAEKKAVGIVAGAISTEPPSTIQFHFAVLERANDLDDALKNASSYLEDIGVEISKLI